MKKYEIQPEKGENIMQVFGELVVLHCGECGDSSQCSECYVKWLDERALKLNGKKLRSYSPHRHMLNNERFHGEAKQ